MPLSPEARENVAVVAGGFDVFGLAEAFSALNPDWKPPGQYGDGLKIIMRSAHGLTDPDVLVAPFFFQSPPLDSFTWSGSYTHDDFDTIASGQFSRRSSRQLRTLPVNTLFIDWDAPWALTPHVLPLEVAKELAAIMETGTPFRLIAHQAEYWGSHNRDIDMLATLRSVSVEQRGGEPDTRYISCDFTEYRVATVTTVAGKKKERSTALALPSSATLHLHGASVSVTIRNGPSIQASKNPTLHDLVKLVYGSYSAHYLNKVRNAKGNEFLKNKPGSTKLVSLVKKGKPAPKIILPK